MANEITATEANVIIPESWQMKVLNARYSKSNADQVAYVEIDNIRSFGDIFHLHRFPRVAVNNVNTSTGAVTNQAITLLEVQLTVNKAKEATVDIVDLVGIQTIFGDPETLASKFAEQFGPAIAEQADNDLFALQSGLTTNVVGDPTNLADMSDGFARQALQKLDEARIPKADRSFVLKSKAFWDLAADNKLAAAFASGLTRGLAISGPDVVPSIYGCKWIATEEVTTSAGADKNLLLHKECLAMGMQKNVSIVHLAKVRLSTPITAWALYGVAAMREDHGCVINTAT